MTSKEFVIWLDGYLEGNGDVGLTTMQVRDLVNKLHEVDLNEKEIKSGLIIERGVKPLNPIKIQEPIEGDNIDFPGKPPNVYM